MNKLYIGIGAIVLAAIFYYGGKAVGWSERGEHEAENTTRAINKAVNEKLIEWERQNSIAIKTIRKETLATAKTKIITKEVIKYVKTRPVNHECYGPTGVQLINQAVSNAGARNTERINTKIQPLTPVKRRN